jgi:DNA-directed RNA polymerase specialized sigma24 family protein
LTQVHGACPNRPGCKTVGAWLGALPSLLRVLSPRDRDLLSMRFVHDMTQTEIAARLGCSQMQVSRLLRRALAQLIDAAGKSETRLHAIS